MLEWMHHISMGKQITTKGIQNTSNVMKHTSGLGLGLARCDDVHLNSASLIDAM